MALRNTEAGYGSVTKTLHWLVFLLLVMQFTVGYAMDWVEETGVLGLTEDTVFAVHTTLGLVVLLVVAVRIVWRWTTPLPAWAEGLSAAEQTFTSRVEHALYALMLWLPLSGLLAAVANGEELTFFAFAIELDALETDALEDPTVAAHVAGHLAFFAVFALHLGFVLKHQLVNRDGLAYRMLPTGGR